MNTAKIGLIVIVLLVGYQILGGCALAQQQETIHGNTGEVWNQVNRGVELLPRLESQVLFAYSNRDGIIDKIVTARNNLLAAQKVGDLAKAIEASQQASLSLSLLVENYPNVSLTEVQRGLMDETAGTLNRIAYARGKLINAEVSYNQSRIMFFPVGIMAFPRSEVLGESANPEQRLPGSRFDPTPTR